MLKYLAALYQVFDLNKFFVTSDGLLVLFSRISINHFVNLNFGVSFK